MKSLHLTSFSFDVRIVDGLCSLLQSPKARGLTHLKIKDCGKGYDDASWLRLCHSLAGNPETCLERLTICISSRLPGCQKEGLISGISKLAKNRTLKSLDFDILDVPSFTLNEGHLLLQTLHHNFAVSEFQYQLCYDTDDVEERKKGETLVCNINTIMKLNRNGRGYMYRAW